LNSDSASIDGSGRILGEYGASASDVIAEHLWLSPDAANDNQPFGGDDGINGYAPLAISSAPTGGTAQLIWVHGNHMGVPLTYTNTTGAEISPPSFTQSAFPGQMKTLPDLYYNRYRDYDPSTGRYIQADPIGLAGDPNPYAYAMNNPLRYADPMGEASTQKCSPYTKLWYDLLKSAACNGPTAPRKCTGEMGEAELRLNLKRFQACTQARDDVINICYGGVPDVGHRQALLDSIRGRDKCAERLKICRPAR
jgi:RHS repeat-associated protein